MGSTKKPLPAISRPLLPVLFAIVTTGACTHLDTPQKYLRQYDAIPHSPTRFTICSRADCEETFQVTLKEQDWDRVRAAFSPQPADSAQERERIASAIALFENLVGVQAGTFDDQPAGEGMFRSTRQLDCVAETTNTTVYLLQMQQQGLLRWHSVAFPKHRGFIHLQMPHNTAVIVDISSGKKFAVDTYYHGNGEAPEIVPLENWMAGYSPKH